jgi:hypothetical protein
VISVKFSRQQKRWRKYYSNSENISQLWPILIVARNKQRNTKRSTHHALLSIRTLAKSQS